MKQVSYLVHKVIYKLKGNDKEVISNFCRKNGVKVGAKCNICCNIITPESQLIEIGNNVTIASSVQFVTHDNSISKVLPNTTDLFGKIKIGNNCFIGQRSTILYGVSLADNIIVAAGSVVVGSFTDEKIIIGGNPAKIISTWDSFAEKSSDFAWNLDKESIDEVFTSKNRLIQR